MKRERAVFGSSHTGSRRGIEPLAMVTSSASSAWRATRKMGITCPMPRFCQRCRSTSPGATASARTWNMFAPSARFVLPK
ncbi:MAG: hypothetical protein M5U28_07360 [Sandaracinaceae bacterium]|nr:hypothetical protein [Sandaracinaceae bacterium]